VQASVRVPRHVGIIMDGNGRWARGRNRPHSFGHRAGVRAIKRVMYGCEERGIEVLSVYAFSTENWTRPRANGTLNVCLNYGGRAELVDAARSLVASGLGPDQVDEKAIAAHLYQPQLPDVDLIIRTAGESRMSNFMLWQAYYAELCVTETLWPDFDVADLDQVLSEYQGRVRRFGGRPDLRARLELSS
jgi:undecaprenyl diphosphate synthase